MLNYEPAAVFRKQPDDSLQLNVVVSQLVTVVEQTPKWTYGTRTGAQPSLHPGAASSKALAVPRIALAEFKWSGAHRVGVSSCFVGTLVIVGSSLRSNAMQRPTRFESFRYIGDKRTQVVYDTDRDDSATRAAINELMESEQFAVFGPDTPGEARNRGYHLPRYADDDRESPES